MWKIVTYPFSGVGICMRSRSFIIPFTMKMDIREICGRKWPSIMDYSKQAISTCHSRINWRQRRRLINVWSLGEFLTCITEQISPRGIARRKHEWQILHFRWHPLMILKVKVYGNISSKQQTTTSKKVCFSFWVVAYIRMYINKNVSLVNSLCL